MIQAPSLTLILFSLILCSLVYLLLSGCSPAFPPSVLFLASSVLSILQGAPEHITRVLVSPTGDWTVPDSQAERIDVILDEEAAEVAGDGPGLEAPLGVDSREERLTAVLDDGRDAGTLNRSAVEVTAHCSGASFAVPALPEAGDVQPAVRATRAAGKHTVILSDGEDGDDLGSGGNGADGAAAPHIGDDGGRSGGGGDGESMPHDWIDLSDEDNETCCTSTKPPGRDAPSSPTGLEAHQPQERRMKRKRGDGGACTCNYCSKGKGNMCKKDRRQLRRLLISMAGTTADAPITLDA